MSGMKMSSKGVNPASKNNTQQEKVYTSPKNWPGKKKKQLNQSFNRFFFMVICLILRNFKLEQATRA
jgi:hypothetical protein